MKLEEIVELKREIRELKIMNMEELFIQAVHIFKVMLKSNFIFGRDSIVTQDSKKFLKEFFDIMKEEFLLLNYVQENSNKINYLYAQIFLGYLDILHEDTFDYYTHVLDEIDDACVLKQDWRAKRPKKDFDTLIESNCCWQEAIALVITLEDVYSFFGCNDLFINYISSRMILVDDPFFDEKMWYGVYLKYTVNQLDDIRIVVPTLGSLDSVLANVYIFGQAYELYQRIGQSVVEQEEFDNIGREAQIKFKEKCLSKLN